MECDFLGWQPESSNAAVWSSSEFLIPVHLFAFRSNPRKMRSEDLLLSGIETLSFVQWIKRRSLMTNTEKPTASVKVDHGGSLSVCASICMQQKHWHLLTGLAVPICARERLHFHSYLLHLFEDFAEYQTDVCVHASCSTPRHPENSVPRCRRIRYRFVGSWV